MSFVRGCVNATYQKVIKKTSPIVLFSETHSAPTRMMAPAVAGPRV
jgi:hypothetical protein